MITYQQMACHTWALAANPDTAAQIHTSFENLCNTLGARYEYGTNLRGQSLQSVRKDAMQEISSLCEQRTTRTNNAVFLCGGFRNGQVCPEHLWLEDHSAWKTYDTFINQKVAIVNRAGTKNAPFQPGCEAQAFAANEIARVLVMGFTAGQIDSIDKYSEQRD